MMSGSEAVLYAEAFSTIAKAVYMYVSLAFLIWILKTLIPILFKSMGDALFDSRLNRMESRILDLENEEEVDEQ